MHHPWSWPMGSWGVACAALVCVAGSAVAGEPVVAPSAGAEGADYEALLKQQASILEELDRLDADIELRESDLEGLQDQRQDVAVALIDLEVRFESATKELVETRTLARKRLRSFLAAERQSRLVLALDQESALDSARRQRVIAHLLDHDRERIGAYRARLDAWRADRDVLDAKRAELDALEEKVAGLKLQLEGERTRREEILRRVNTDRRFFEKAHADALAAHAALADRIRKLEVWRGKQLRFASHKGKFRLPMSYARVVTPFGQRTNAKLGTATLHPGMEIASQGSTSVRAVYWGRVAYVGWILGYGTTVILDHTEGFHTVYARLDKVDIKEGDVVESRQVLGTIGGSSALGTPNTLLFELRHQGEAIDPAGWFL